MLTGCMSGTRLFPSAVTFISLMTLLGLSGCTEERQTLGYAYVAPQTLTVRSQISQKSGAVTTLKHGDKVEIVDVQRRLVKVAARGNEGWVDAEDLLSSEQMREIQKDRERQKALPSQGAASAFEILNIHIEPSRRSPAFAQIPEGGPVEILGRMRAPKNAPPTKTSSLLLERPAPPRRPRKEQQAKGGFHLVRPAPPKPPANWQELSAERIDGSKAPREIAADKKKAAQELAAKKVVEAKRPVVMEDWTLIRTKKGDTGWVLTRNLTIAIPDDVAQYAEGKRITSYFELGSVNDEEKGLKHHWLWTTLAGSDAVDFDSWRVFIWNLRRHRFETSFRKRDIDGYFPVTVDPAEGKTVGRTFHIITKDDDEKFRSRTYSFDGTLVRLTGTEDLPAGPGSMVTQANPSGLDTNKMQSKVHPSWFRRQWSALLARFNPK
jgi:uncharacterized protein YgiM (DUF1202 family)